MVYLICGVYTCSYEYRARFAIPHKKCLGYSLPMKDWLFWFYTQWREVLFKVMRKQGWKAGICGVLLGPKVVCAEAEVFSCHEKWRRERGEFLTSKTGNPSLPRSFLLPLRSFFQQFYVEGVDSFEVFKVCSHIRWCKSVINCALIYKS